MRIASILGRAGLATYVFAGLLLCVSLTRLPHLAHAALGRLFIPLFCHAFLTTIHMDSVWGTQQPRASFRGPDPIIPALIAQPGVCRHSSLLWAWFLHRFGCRLGHHHLCCIVWGGLSLVIHIVLRKHRFSAAPHRCRSSAWNSKTIPRFRSAAFRHSGSSLSDALVTGGRFTILAPSEVSSAGLTPWNHPAHPFLASGTHRQLIASGTSNPVHPICLAPSSSCSVVQVGIVPSVPNTRGHAACIRWHLRTIRCLAPVLPRSLADPPLLACCFPGTHTSSLLEPAIQLGAFWREVYGGWMLLLPVCLATHEFRWGWHHAPLIRYGLQPGAPLGRPSPLGQLDTGHAYPGTKGASHPCCSSSVWRMAPSSCTSLCAPSKLPRPATMRLLLSPFRTLIPMASTIPCIRYDTG